MFKKMFFIAALPVAFFSGLQAMLPRVQPRPKSLAVRPVRRVSQVKPDGVYPYQASYEKSVSKIALEHMPALATTRTYTPERYQELLQEQILPVLNAPNYCTSKVYIKDGKPVGFITYSLYYPWHRYLTPKSEEIGPNAEIHHLAVDTEHARSGYGSALLQAALEDLRSQSVNRVSLMTTKYALESFYSRFGFQLVKESKHFCQEYAIRFKQHPARLIVGAAMHYLFGK